MRALARRLPEDRLNAMMEERATELAGATGTQRNGHREHMLDNAIGTIRLRVPKLGE